MKKTLAVVILIAGIVFALNAEVGIRIGHGAIAPDFKNGLGLTVLAGLDFGLTDTLELNVEAMTPVVPDPFSKVVAGFELGYAVSGKRVAKDGYAGSAINQVVSVGFFTENLVPTYITLRITPVTVGTPAYGRRESLLPIGIAWNFRDNSVGLFISIIMYDHYISGTWRDYV